MIRDQKREKKTAYKQGNGYISTDRDGQVRFTKSSVYEGFPSSLLARSAEAVEYTDCIPAEG